jgi:hypothetical protein
LVGRVRRNEDPGECGVGYVCEWDSEREGQAVVILGVEEVVLARNSM